MTALPTWDELDTYGHTGPAEEPPPTPADQIRDRLLTTDDLKNIPRPEPIVDGLLYRNSLAMLYGPSGAGKSFIGVDIAMTVATPGHDWWHSCAIDHGPVLYIVAEGVSGMSLRTEAWLKRHGPDDHSTVKVWWHPTAINVFDPMWASALAEVVAELRPSLVVIDTYARATLGLEENATKDTSVVIAHLDMIRQAAGCCVLIVHHSGKNIEAGARGASALKGAMDTEIELIGDDMRMRLTNTKQKDAPEMAPIWLKLDGEADSAVVVAASAKDDDINDSVMQTYEALAAVQIEGGVSNTAWMMAASASERSFYRHRKTLLEHALVLNKGSEKQPRYITNPNAEGS